MHESMLAWLNPAVTKDRVTLYVHMLEHNTCKKKPLLHLFY